MVRLENVLKISLQDVLKTSWRHMAKANIFVLIKTSWRRLQNIFWRRKSKDIFIKTNVCWVLSYRYCGFIFTCQNIGNWCLAPLWTRIWFYLSRGSRPGIFNFATKLLWIYFLSTNIDCQEILSGRKVFLALRNVKQRNKQYLSLSCFLWK